MDSAALSTTLESDSRVTPLSWQQLTGMFLGFFVLRSLVTFPAENIDAVFKYHIAAEIVRGGGWELLLSNQHSMRWVEMLPQVLVTWATQFRYEGLYLLPLAAFAAYCTAIVAALWRHLEKPGLFILAGLLFIEPLALNHTGQLLNPPFGVLFTVLAVLCLSRDLKPGNARVVLAAVLLFCAYGAHVTYLAFAGGVFVWLLWRRPAAAALLALALAALFIVETLVFNALSGGELVLGRVQALAQTSHVDSVVSGGFSAGPSVSLFNRWLRLPAFNMVLVAAFLILTLAASWHWFRHRNLAGSKSLLPAMVIGCLWAATGYALGVTLAVVDFNPVKPLLPFRNMYLQVFMPFAIIATAWLLQQFLRRWRLEIQLLILATGSSVMAVFFVMMVETRGNLEDVINSRVSAFFWYSNTALADYSERFARGELLVKGPNTRGMVLLAWYQNPVRTRTHEQGGVSARDLKPDALCVSSLRKMPTERNFQPCAGFRPHKRNPILAMTTRHGDIQL